MEPSGSKHPFNHLLKELTVGDKKYKYYSLPALNDERLKKLPISIRVLLECCIRNCDEFNILHEDVSKILSWHTSSNEGA
jgi:aconitate hydratase